MLRKKFCILPVFFCMIGWVKLLRITWKCYLLVRRLFLLGIYILRGRWARSHPVKSTDIFCGSWTFLFPLVMWQTKSTYYIAVSQVLLSPEIISIILPHILHFSSFLKYLNNSIWCTFSKLLYRHQNSHQKENFNYLMTMST